MRERPGVTAMLSAELERHPLLVQVEQLKALCNEMHNCMCDWKEESWGFGRWFAERMVELGVPIGRR